MLRLETLEDSVAFANQALATDGVEVFEAQKPSGKFVKAAYCPAGSKGDTYNRDGEFEQSWEAKEDCYLITACDAEGNEFLAEDVNHSGVMHVNAWPISITTFEEKYGSENVGPNGVVAAKSIPQQFIRLDETIGVPEDGVVLRQSWGADEHMAQGAVMNISDLDKGKVYAIDPTYFKENYEVLGPVSIQMPEVDQSAKTMIGKTVSHSGAQPDKDFTA